MPSRAQALDRDALALERAEDRAARQVAQAYNNARRELVATLLERWSAPGVMTPGQAVELFRRLGLVTMIDGRLRTLEQEVGLVLRGIVTSSTETALEAMAQQLALLPVELRPNIANFVQIDTALIERFVPVAMNDIRAITGTMSSQLTSAVQNGLIQGESFPNLIHRLMASVPTGEQPAIWNNGRNSAELMTRRLVITANNSAKISALDQVNQQGGVQVKKQWNSVINERTTDCYLRAHGQIREVNERFRLTGTPRFASELLSPPGHWRCRSSVTMYHPVFERGGLTTPNMEKSAAAELKRRDANGNRGKEL